MYCQLINVFVVSLLQINMPVSGQEHRAKIGLFYATNAIILEKKQKKQVKRTKSSLFDEICSWGSCLSITLMYLCFLLLLSNDVETNPGPEQSTQISSSNCCSHFTEHVEKGFQRMFYSLKANSAFIHYDIGSKIARVDGLVSHMQHTITDLMNVARENTNSINNLLAKQDVLLRQLNLAENEIDRLEVAKRATNVKIYGLIESSNDCIDSVINMLNHFSSDPNWERGHIESAYRVGKRQGKGGRPTVVTFVNLGDKVFVLRDKDMRNRLRREGIKISEDLTSKQQADINFFKDKGYHAYYKKGKLIVENDQGQVVNHKNLSKEPIYDSTEQDTRHGSDHYTSQTQQQQSDDRRYPSQPASHQFYNQPSFVSPVAPWLREPPVPAPPCFDIFPPYTNIYGANPPSPYPNFPQHPHYRSTLESDPTDSEAMGNMGRAYSNPYAFATSSLAAVARQQATAATDTSTSMMGYNVDNNDDDAFVDATDDVPAADTEGSRNPVPEERQFGQPAPESSSDQTSMQPSNQAKGQDTVTHPQDIQGNLQTVSNQNRRSSIDTKIPILKSVTRIDQKPTKDSKQKTLKVNDSNKGAENDTNSTSKITHFMELRSRRESNASTDSSKK